MLQIKVALLALGANLPFEGMTPDQTLLAAIKSFPSVNLAVPQLSRLFATPCFPAGAGPDYVNAAALLQVDRAMTAASLLDHLHQVEAMYGRRRETRWGMRTLDIDLLAIGDEVLPDGPTQSYWRTLDPNEQSRAAPDQLILPHPRLQDRAFVLLPLADVAANWRHPVLGLSVAQMLAALPAGDLAEIRPI
jgi:2-amino-4-hydroxy-6-hydroxymethyldihydropteridine diphosphokinase